MGFCSKRSVDKKQVQPAIVVVIEHGDAGPHRFRKIFLRSAARFMFKADAGLRGDVGEYRQHGTRCRKWDREACANKERADAAADKARNLRRLNFI